MANIKSQIKRIEIGERNNAHHSARKSETRTQVKKAELAIAAKNKEVFPVSERRPGIFIFKNKSRA